MVTRRSAALALTLAVAGCHGSGTHYTLVVTPSPGAQTGATELSVNLLRTGTVQARNISFPVPRPPPMPPWIFDLQTREWGAAPIEVEVFALSGAGVIANGSSGPEAGIINITLMDTFFNSTPDLAFNPFPTDGFADPPPGFGDLPFPVLFDFGQAVTDSGAPSDGGAPDDAGD